MTLYRQPASPVPRSREMGENRCSIKARLGNRCDIPRLTQSFDLPRPELDPPTAGWLLWQHGFSRRRDREKVPYLRRLSSLVAGLAVTTFLGSPFGPALAQDAATSAALAGEAAHAQKMGKLFPDTGTGTQASPAVIPTVDNDDDPSGKVQTFQPNGPTKTANHAFFQALGTNGRSCFTCHQSQDAWTISAQHVRDRFDENPKPGKPEPYRIRCSPETPGAGGEVEAAADGPLSRAPFRRALVL